MQSSIIFSSKRIRKAAENAHANIKHWGRITQEYTNTLSLNERKYVMKWIVENESFLFEQKTKETFRRLRNNQVIVEYGKYEHVKLVKKLAIGEHESPCIFHITSGQLLWSPISIRKKADNMSSFRWLLLALTNFASNFVIKVAAFKSSTSRNIFRFNSCLNLFAYSTITTTRLYLIEVIFMTFRNRQRSFQTP